MRLFFRKLNSISRAKKRALMFGSDVLMIVLSLYLTIVVYEGPVSAWKSVTESWFLFPLMLVLGAVTVFSTRLHQIKLHAMDHSAFLRVGVAAGLVSVFFFLVLGLFETGLAPSSTIVFGSIFFVTSVLLKVTGLHALLTFSPYDDSKVHVAIYGAGAAGIQLAAALRQSSEAKPCFFIDDNPNLQGLLMSGLKVMPMANLEKNISRHGIRRILLAIPSVDRSRRNEILQELSKLSVEVMVLPSYVDLMGSGGIEDALRTVTPDELLGRDKVELDIPEMTKVYAGRSIMVTGAGGSIGSELCRQLLNRDPTKIVLFEQSELALYSIDREMRTLAASSGKSVEIITKLGSVTNPSRVQGVVQQFSVDIVLHAAAYKHVPLVEENELEGANNNVLGTQVVAEIAAAKKIERFILVSTDKAVRPTNIMGATKRLAELVVQDIQTRNTATKFSMVRFGNVLGSSGSVLPLFESQIRAGGPVTVTHPDVTRFFMTIPEAARLVLLAGAYAHGGDVFVLDMGKPQKIIEIARKMIQLSGRTIKPSPEAIGDVEIEIVGLRPGEKLYEELLIDNDSLVATPHPKILRAQEAQLSEIEVAAFLKEISSAIATSNSQLLRRTVQSRVDGYHQPAVGSVSV